MTRSPIIVLLAAIAAIVVLGSIFVWMVRTARRPLGAETIVALILGLLVIEASLYENPDLLPPSIFHPQVGSLSFRIFDLLVPMAIAARFVARPTARRLPVQMLFWSAFLVWLLFEALEGIVSGYSKTAVTYEAKAIIYVGMFVLAAAVPANRWLESRALRRVVLMSSALAAFLVATMETHVTFNANIPLLPLEEFGVLGTDAATIFAVLGIITLAVGSCSDKHRVKLILVALPLLAAPLVSGQRAAMLSLATTLIIVGIGAALGRRHIRVTWAEIGLIAAAALAVVAALITVSAMTGRSQVSLPLAKQIQETFGSRGKELSAEERVNQWAQARGLIANRPLLGWGLGKEYSYYAPGTYEFVKTNLTHNIILDLLVRTGAMGLALFLLAVVTSLYDSILASVREVDPRVKAIALGCMAAFLGVLMKGMFESIFEKYRIALLLGGLIGVSASFAASRINAMASEQDKRAFGAHALTGAVRQ